MKPSNVKSVTSLFRFIKPIVSTASAKIVGTTNEPQKPNSMIGHRLYLAGPIRGREHDAKARFAFATEKLRAQGYKVFNPMEQDELLEKSGTSVVVETVLKLDLIWIIDHADCVALLEGWNVSSGANAEYWTAIACGRKTWELPAEYWL